nr:hypothetical protein [Tanacetum cinerariifolium]
MFKGVQIGSSLYLFHLFYDDDVVFKGQWSDSNILILIKALKCFFYASGLRINMHKSKLMGIDVDDDTMIQAARSIGCLQLKPPFSYLGTKIGSLMSRINSWDEINKLLARLSKWKMKTLSIGGRFTLLKSVLGSTLIFICLFLKCLLKFLKGWKLSEAVSLMGWTQMKRKCRGLAGIRFKSDNSSLWARFIKAMQGNDGLLGKSVKSHFPSIWLDIIRVLDNLKDQAFKSLYPRIYVLETCKKINVASKMAHDNLGISLRRPPRSGVVLEQFNDMSNSLVGFQLPSMIDRWFWSLSGLGVFSVASVRKFVDDHFLPEIIYPFGLIFLEEGWIFILFFVRFGEKHAETSGHTFFACSMASDIFRNIAFWWDVNPPQVASFEEWELWMSSLNLSSNRKLLLGGVIYTAWWFIWNFQNKMVFGSTSPSKAVLFDDIVAHSFQWCKHRGRFKI